MKINKVALVITMAAGMMGTYAFAASQTLTGKLTDNMCTKKHMVPGKTDAECTRACANMGGYYVVVSGNKVYKITGDQKKFSDLAGEQVKITGELKGDTIAVSSISTAK